MGDPYKHYFGNGVWGYTDCEHNNRNCSQGTVIEEPSPNNGSNCKFSRPDDVFSENNPDLGLLNEYGWWYNPETASIINFSIQYGYYNWDNWDNLGEAIPNAIIALPFNLAIGSLTGGGSKVAQFGITLALEGVDLLYSSYSDSIPFGTYSMATITYEYYEYDPLIKMWVYRGKKYDRVLFLDFNNGNGKHLHYLDYSR